MKDKPVEDGTSLVEVYRAEDGVIAHLLKSALNEAGVSAYVTDEPIAAVRGLPMWWACPRVLVAAADAQAALAVIRELESTRAKRRADDGE
jgi:hypothetical protein